MTTSKRLVVVSISIVAIGGCVRAHLPPAPAHPVAEAGFGKPQNVVPPGLKTDPPLPMRLLPGDELTLQTVSADTNSYPGLVVDELGHLHVPLAGDVEVGGKTLGDAEKAIEKALRAYDRTVRVNVFITNPAGHKATVIGAVATPGRIVVPPGTRLADLLALAGGPIREQANAETISLADLGGARLIRNNKVVPVSLKLALLGDPHHNVRVHPGDQLYVPPTRGQRLSVLGKVQTPTVLPFRPGIRLTEALAIAGGINTDGDRADIRVIRGPLDHPEVYETSLRAIVDGKSHDVQLAAGDIVYVTEHWLASVGDVLNRLSPILSAGTTFGVTYAATRLP